MMTETMEYLEERQTSDPSFTYEVLIVDDGSKDITTEVLNISLFYYVHYFFCNYI